MASLRRYVAANLPEEARRGRRSRCCGDAGRAGAGGADRLRAAGLVDRPGDGRRRTVWAFVMVLACSRHMFVRPVLGWTSRRGPRRTSRRSRSSAGCPARLVPDNLQAPGWTGRTCMTRRSTGPMPSSPRTTASWSTRPGPRKPKDKPRVERPMPYVRDSFWRGREFTSLAQMQAAAVRWCREVAGPRRLPAAGRRRPGGGVRRGRGRGAAAAAAHAVRAGDLVDGEGRPGHPRQGRQDAVLGAVAAHRPAGRRPRDRRRWCRSSTTASWSPPTPRKPQGKQTDLAHYPPEKIAFQMRTPTWCRTPRRRDRPGLQRGHRRAAGGQRPVPAARRPGRARPGRQARPGAGSRPPAPRRSRPATRPTAPSRASCRRHRDRHRSPRPAGDGGAAAFLHGPAAVRDVIPDPAAGRHASDRRPPAHHAADRDDRARRTRQASRSAGTPDRPSIDTALHDSAAHPEAVRHAATPSTPASPRPAPASSATWTSCRSSATTRSPAARPSPSPAGCAGPGSSSSHPGRLRLRRQPEAARRRRSATWPPCAGSTPESRSSSTARSASARPTSPKPSATSRSAAAAEVRFTKTSRVLADLAGGHADRTWDRRLRELRPPRRADPRRLRHARAHRTPSRRPLRTGLRTSRPDRPLILTSNRAPTDWYPLFPNPVVAESLLDRLINTSHQVFMNGPSYRPRKRPRPVDSTTTRQSGVDTTRRTTPGELRDRHPWGIT